MDMQVKVNNINNSTLRKYKKKEDQKLKIIHRFHIMIQLKIIILKYKWWDSNKEID